MNHGHCRSSSFIEMQRGHGHGISKFGVVSRGGRGLIGGGALSTGAQGNRLTISSARKGRHLDKCWRMEAKCKFQNRTLKLSR